MSFIDIPDLEPQDIMIVGDWYDTTSIKIGRQFGVAQEGALEQGLHMANLTKSEIGMDAVLPYKSKPDGFWVDHDKPHKRYFTDAGKAAVTALRHRLVQRKAKVVVPLGKCAVQALTGRTDYTDIRGYPFGTEDFLVIPSVHPRDMIWSNYVWRFYLSNDLNRAHKFARGIYGIRYPDLRILDTFPYAMEILKRIEFSNRVSIDIEVSNYEVSCLGFSTEKDIGYSLPIDNRWSDIEETQLWNVAARILGNPSITKVGQNFIFDTYFLAYRMGIITRGPLQDTMMAHSIQYPDFLKGLGFLGGIHTTYTYWKDEMDFKNIKEES
jgi:uracil-DNA glycosylase